MEVIHFLSHWRDTLMVIDSKQCQPTLSASIVLKNSIVFLWHSNINWLNFIPLLLSSVSQSVSSVSQSVQSLNHVWLLASPMDCSMPGFPVHHQLPELALTHVHRVGDAIQPSYPLPSPPPPAFILSQHQGLFQWVSSSHQVARVLEFQLQHQSFQWTPKTDFL